LACVTVRDENGKRREILLGPWGSPASRAEHARILAELAANQGRLAARHQRPADVTPDITVNELILAFWHHAEEHYRDAAGQPTGELNNLKEALRPLRKLYGHTAACSFDSVALECIQAELVRSGRLARSTINARINRIRRAFRWAVRKKLVPVEVLSSLDTVPGLQRNRTEAREAGKVAPVPVEHVEATLPFLPRPVAAMVRVQLLCGCRPGEVMVMRAKDLTRGDAVWLYEPHVHKNAWRGQGRKIFLGPRAQGVLKAFLGESPEELLFRPSEATREHHASRAAARKSRRTPSELDRKRKSTPLRQPGARYNRRSYRQAIVRACRKAGVPEWSPLQLRHLCATAVRARHGLEAAQCLLGHAHADVTELYAERNEGLAMRIMAELG
jgi:integrase